MTATNKAALDSDNVKATLDYRDFNTLRHWFKDHEIADVARLFADLELKESVALFRLVPRVRRAELFSYLPFDRQESLLAELPDTIVTTLLNEMDPDDRTHFLAELPEEIRTKVIHQLDPAEGKVAAQLLSYPEGSVGRLMTPDFLVLNGSMKVKEALDKIHWNTTLPTDFLNYLFVSGDNGQLIGEVALASLVVCDPPSTLIREIMRKSNVSLHPEQEETVAVDIFRRYDRTYIPVVDAGNTILGIVTADDVFDVAEEEATEEIHQFGGHVALEESYFQTPFFAMLKKRAGWLSFLFISGFITGEAMRIYADFLTKFAFLMFFLPNIISSGGNSGTQSASLIIRGFALNEVTLKDVWRVLGKELLVGLALGVILAGFAFIRVLSWGLGVKVGAIIVLSVIGVVVFGVITGSMLPFIMKKLKIDPAIASSPFISTIVDVSGVLITFNMTMVVGKYLGL
jgi:magnesium transporter